MLTSRPQIDRKRSLRVAHENPGESAEFRHTFCGINEINPVIKS